MALFKRELIKKFFFYFICKIIVYVLTLSFLYIKIILVRKVGDKVYVYKDGLNYKINQTKASEIIGITQPTLSNIFNRKVACRKVVAYCITKYINENANIEDFFERVK